MTLYSVLLYVHVVTALGVFAALALEAVTLFRLRQSEASAEVRAWIDLVPGLPQMTMATFVLLLLSGIYLTVQISGWTLAWPKLAMAALVLIGPFGAISGRRMRAIRNILHASNPNESELIGRLHDPFLKLSLSLRISLVLGIVLLMTAKPGMAESLSIVGAFALLGIVLAFLPSRRGAARAVRTGS